MQERDLGSMGEALFMQLCAATGLICNPSAKDSAGWDFIVDFPSHFSSHLLIDKCPPPVECKVQVKATDGSAKKVQITLSNMMRLCSSKLPAFIFFIEYDGNSTPQAAYIRHIDKDLTFKTLKRARQNSATQKQKRLNKINLTVNFDNSHKLNEITGDLLKKSIEYYIPKGMGAYIEEKTTNLKHLGYENGGYSLKFKTNSKVECGDLIEASLGWVSKARIRNLEWFDKRFDISMPIEEMNAPEAELSFGFESFEQDVTLKITNSISKKSIRTKCKLYTSPLVFNAPDEHVKVRLKSSYFDILIALKSGVLTYRFDSSENLLSLFEIRDNLILMRWVYEQRDELEFTLESPTLPKRIVLITNKSKKFKKNKQLIDNCIQALETTENAILIARQLGIEAQITTKITELNKYRDNINRIGWLLKKPDEETPIKLAFKDEVESPPPEINACCLAVMNTNLGDFAIHVIFTITGKGVYSSNEYLLSNPEIKIEEIIDSAVNGNITTELIKKTDLIAAEYTNSNCDITFINMFHHSN